MLLTVCRRYARDEAMARVKLSEQQKKDLEARLGSIQYEVATMDEWKKAKVIADPIFGGPRVKSLANVQFNKTQDIRNNNIVTFDLRDFPDLRRIKRIDVFPRSFKLGQEYDVAFDSDGLKAHVMILNLDVFVGQKVIFALRD